MISKPIMVEGPSIPSSNGSSLVPRPHPDFILQLWVGPGDEAKMEVHNSLVRHLVEIYSSVVLSPQRHVSVLAPCRSGRIQRPPDRLC